MIDVEPQTAAAHRRALVARIASLMLVVLGVWYAMDYVIVVKSESIKYHVMLKALSNEVHVGDYVTFHIIDPIIDPENPAVLTKRVACLAGDRLEFDGIRHACNGKLLGAVLSETRKGAPLVPFRFNGVIPSGKMFVVGDHPRSYDSRYFGFIDRDRVRRVIGVF